VRPHLSSTNNTFLIFLSGIIDLKMMLFASNLLAVSMDVVVLVFIVLRLNVQVIDILSGQSDLFAHFGKGFSQKIDLEMILVGLRDGRHVVNAIDPFPNVFRVLAEHFESDEFLRSVRFFL
jgi:hypothetical protein